MLYLGSTFTADAHGKGLYRWSSGVYTYGVLCSQSVSLAFQSTICYLSRRAIASGTITSMKTHLETYLNCHSRGKQGWLVVCHLRSSTSRQQAAGASLVHTHSRQGKYPIQPASHNTRVHDCVCAACLSTWTSVPRKHGILQSRVIFSFSPSCQHLSNQVCLQFSLLLYEYHRTSSSQE